ncbi:MAG: hypothetical protein KAS32_01330 [Candidatus Peribacteraceae bacterium]|nr:hypothetical protein [Candidatus Peribacteraceae bacterium]
MTDTVDTNKNNFDLISEDAICLEVMNQHLELWDDLQWDEFTLKERLEKNPWQYQQYRMLWLKERHNLKKIEILMDEYIGQLYDELKYDGDKKLSKTEIEKYYIPKDDKVKQFRVRYMRQGIRTDIYGEIAVSFKNQGFEMNSYVKALQL